MEQRIVGRAAVGPDPQPLDGLLLADLLKGSSPMWRWSMGWGRSNQSPRVSR